MQEVNKAETLSDDIRLNLIELLHKLQEDVIWRNLAVHSAWSKVDGEYRVVFFKRVSKDLQDINSYRAFVPPVSLEELIDASEKASSYLRHILELTELVEEQL